MEVTLKKLDIDVPARAFAESCKSAGEFAEILCELAERVKDMDETTERIFMNSIIPRMSLNGRNFVHGLYGGVLHYDKIEAIQIKNAHRAIAKIHKNTK